MTQQSHRTIGQPATSETLPKGRRKKKAAPKRTHKTRTPAPDAAAAGPANEPERSPSPPADLLGIGAIRVEAWLIAKGFAPNFFGDNDHVRIKDDRTIWRRSRSRGEQEAKEIPEEEIPDDLDFCEVYWSTFFDGWYVGTPEAIGRIRKAHDVFQASLNDLRDAIQDQRGWSYPTADGRIGKAVAS